MTYTASVAAVASTTPSDKSGSIPNSICASRPDPRISPCAGCQPARRWLRVLAFALKQAAACAAVIVSGLTRSAPRLLPPQRAKAPTIARTLPHRSRAARGPNWRPPNPPLTGRRHLLQSCVFTMWQDSRSARTLPYSPHPLQASRVLGTLPPVAVAFHYAARPCPGCLALRGRLAPLGLPSSRKARGGL